ncbi:putative uroporphyrinogen-III C-methyltransferase [Janthinobacterium sp. HH103]|uniref:uroporphyrinogen-III C-methyltransferase n=1 Tax=unclassified Janthinobacterium TaxID=2610881 RepID=UPI0008741F48|nr:MULTISPECIES: uroporphyrinogen-III C-methyltransferase [unclassified Janthinobacterium]OEZ64885.1 putative uroporphyrinogen-III C-methyltransferase [Janthinobacterium sp. HH100]OEZ66701.1 putative uroporphyrinogen-III C-methyltransferase [Janthinobacterium sp. HH103]QOU72691.1 HemX, putative uroporphyrinogen-III C-methyltransferase [Janthinobacterium sp. HH102]
MNEMPTLSEPNATPGSAVKTAPQAADQPAGRAPTLLEQLQKPMSIAVIVLAVLLAAQSWSSSKQIRNLREEVAKRLQKGDVSNAETGVLARTVQEGTKELEIKVGALENRQSETQSQQLALEQLYNDLSKNRDEWALTEIEQVLSTASQQLQLAGNVPGALIALQNADRSLSRSDKPQFITIRRAIGRDMEKLKALPSVDSTGVALRLDAVIAQVDSLPMLSDETPALPAAPEKPGKAKSVRDASGKLVGPPAPEPLLQKVRDGFNTWSGDMWADVRQLIRIRRVDTPEALMLSPTQSYFLRENVKLRLLNARMALLSRNETAFRNDLIAAQDALAKYFDTRAKSTQTAQALLRQVQGSNLAIEMPTLSDSLTAVRNYKAKS